MGRLYLGAYGNLTINNNIGFDSYGFPGSKRPELGLYATGTIDLAGSWDTYFAVPEGDVLVDATFNGISNAGNIISTYTAHFDTSSIALAASKGININTTTYSDTNTYLSANNNVSGGISITNVGNITIADETYYGSVFC